MSAGKEADEALARRAAAGDVRAFAELIARHSAALHRLARRCTGDSEAALDLVQESFAAAWLGLSRYDPERPFLAWLRVIALNKCRDAARRSRARPRLFAPRANVQPAPDLVDPAPGAEARLVEGERLHALEAAIAALPPQLKEPLILTALEGLSHAEAARLLGISSKAVETRVARARGQLQSRLGAYRQPH